MTATATTQPTHGWTSLGQAVHANTLDHLPTNNAYSRFNKWLAIKVTTGVGSMTCAYVFSLLALISLPAILSAFKVFHTAFPDWLVKTSLIALVSWIAQTYIQLVLLSVIIVGQNIQSAASDARATKTFEDTEIVVDRLDEKTAGGIKTILDRLDQIEARLPSV
ncbi:MAG TPA: hypothetical protein VNG12_21555 [Acidimicrobiales bacterium]|nr:hypothetical protein [Acidimicrobiales bacterium]